MRKPPSKLDTKMDNMVNNALKKGSSFLRALDAVTPSEPRLRAVRPPLEPQPVVWQKPRAVRLDSQRVTLTPQPVAWQLQPEMKSSSCVVM
jgi:hypothetical protein